MHTMFISLLSKYFQEMFLCVYILLYFSAPDYTQGYRQGHSLQLPSATLSPTLSKATPPPPSPALIPQQLTQKPQNNIKSVSIELPANSCSHCSLPTTSTVAPKPAISPNTGNSNNYNSNTNLFNMPGAAGVPYSHGISSPSIYSSQQNGVSKSSGFESGNSGIPYSQGVSSPSTYPNQQNAFSKPSGSQSENNGLQYSQGISPSNYPGQQKALSKPSNANVPSFTIPSQQSVVGSSLNGQGPISPNPNTPTTNYPLGTQYPQQSNQGPAYNQVSPLSNISPFNPQNKNSINKVNQGGAAGAISDTGKQVSLNSQTQAPGGTPLNNVVPYNLQTNNERTYPNQNMIPTLSVPGAKKLQPSNYQNQAELSNSLGSRTGKQFSQPSPDTNSFNQQKYPQSGTNVPDFQGGHPVPPKPTLVSAQMQIVDKNTDINYKRPGEKNGLPEGITENDVMNLLYTFNYTLGFQAHYEEGYRNGFKQGYYYVTGRNGVRTRIDYTADNTGFHPKISQDVLDLLSDDVPKPETEKDAKYGLRGYEFKWLYYPLEHKKR